jgi:tRNA(adenine34) deaminase
MPCLTAFDCDTYSLNFRYLIERLSMSAAGERDVDAHWMRQAIAAAHDAEQCGEIPVGTCIVSGDTLLAVAGNRTRTEIDPTAHAEVVALREAARRVGNYRLTDAVVYSTIEPCAMCAGALVQARVRRLVYGAADERAGAVESYFGICDTDFLNHRVVVTTGVLEEECRELMQEFFRARRESQRMKAEGRRRKDEGGRTKAEGRKRKDEG